MLWKGWMMHWLPYESMEWVEYPSNSFPDDPGRYEILHIYFETDRNFIVIQNGWSSLLMWFIFYCRSGLYRPYVSTYKIYNNLLFFVYFVSRIMIDCPWFDSSFLIIVTLLHMFFDSPNLFICYFFVYWSEIRIYPWTDPSYTLSSG